MSTLSWFVVTAGALIGLDQIIKTALPLVRLNSQGPFSLPIPNVFVLLVTALLLCVLGSWYYRQQQSVLTWLSASFLFGGGMSNAIDRLLFGGVRDVLVWGSVETNVADVLVVLGLILLLGSVFKKTGWHHP